MTAQEELDAIVVGSGFGGAVTAARLAEAGKRLCILERGRRFEPQDLPVIRDERPVADERRDETRLPDLTKAFWEFGQGLWDVRDLGDTMVGQAAGLGGGSLVYANVHLRAPPSAFESWPACYRDDALETYYDLAAYMLSVQQPSFAGHGEGSERPRDFDLPKTRRFESMSRDKLGERFTHTFRPPLAVNFGARRTNPAGFDLEPCDMCGECIVGCSKRSKSTLDLNYLKRAEDLGADVRTLAEVTLVRRVDDRDDPWYEVEYRDHLQRGKLRTLSARNVFLCAGSVNTTELLLRSRDAGLPLATPDEVGAAFHPNADEVAAVFDCDEEHELDRGPTITSATLYEDGDSWLMFQDGGLPSYLEPFLGLYRSPLWLHRNGFAHRPADADPERKADPQRIAYADLPVESLLDLAASFTGSSIDANMAFAREISESLLALARGDRNFAPKLDPDNPSREWALHPDQLEDALQQIQSRWLADVAIRSEPVVDRFLRTTAAEVSKGLADVLEGRFTDLDLGRLDERELTEWGFRLAVQLVWGSEAGLTGAIATGLGDMLVPSAKEILPRIANLVRWALDFRIGDGHAAILLGFGRDSKPGRLELEPLTLPVGTLVRGAGASGRVVAVSNDVYVLTEVQGTFAHEDVETEDGRAIGRCTRVERLRIAGDAPESGESDATAALIGLHVAPPAADDDPRRFRTDSYRRGRREPMPRAEAGQPRLRARLPRLRETPERGKQELLFRDMADALGGELRTNPVWSMLGRRVTVHAQGGCPMSDRRGTGVTDTDGRVKGCDGLYVMDAAAFPSPVGVNPSATIAAVAEYKIERFIRREIPGWRTKDAVEAAGWAKENRAMLDPLGAHERAAGRRSAPPASRPIGIRFVEAMSGTHRRWIDDAADEPAGIVSDLTATIEDLSAFLALDRRGAPPVARLSGELRIDWGDGVPRVHPVHEPASEMRILARGDETDKETRTIEYRIEFDRDDETWVLDGIKYIRDDERLDVWEDTTTLRFVMHPKDEDSPDRWGVLRLPAAEFFGRQIKSFEATHTGGDAAQEAWAIAAFGRFFFGHLVDVYLPTVRRIGELALAAARREHE